MTEKEIERCLERLATCKTTDVMNFDYAGTLAYIERLKVENDSLKKRLENATDLPCKVGDRFYIVEYYPPEIIEEECCDFSFREFPKILLENGFDCTYELGDNGSYFVTFDKNEAKKIFEKLKKEQKND